MLAFKHTVQSTANKDRFLLSSQTFSMPSMTRYRKWDQILKKKWYLRLVSCISHMIWLMFSQITAPHLVMSGIVTGCPASVAARKQLAPSVSMARTGTSCQPTFSMPWRIPTRRPPPPTTVTTRPGFTGISEWTSWISDSWPSLGQRQAYHRVLTYCPLRDEDGILLVYFSNPIYELISWALPVNWS